MSEYLLAVGFNDISLCLILDDEDLYGDDSVLDDDERVIVLALLAMITDEMISLNLPRLTPVDPIFLIDIIPSIISARTSVSSAPASLVCRCMKCT